MIKRDNEMCKKPDDVPATSAPLRSLYLLLFLWTLLIGGLAAWDIHQTREFEINTAVALVKESYNKDLVYRKWAAMHGGVYVPITERTPTNPYLTHIGDRDITTPSGQRLTLMNPAYMTRQVHEIGKEQYGLLGHITSLTPIRPENAADDWETKALNEFEKGIKEFTSKELIDGKPYIRYMHVLVAEEGCLKCHAGQGYKKGDIRGGISVSIPWTPAREHIFGVLPMSETIYGLIWIVGVGGIVSGRRKLQGYLDERNRAEDQLKESEVRLKAIFEMSVAGIILVSPAGTIDFANRSMAEMFGMELPELIGTDYSDHLHDSEKEIGNELMNQLIKGQRESVWLDRRYIRKDGTDFWGHISGRCLENADGSLRGMVGVISDLTERKQAEKEKQALEQQFQQAQKLESLGVLAGGIAHDFNNILAIIIGYCGLSKMDYEHPEEIITEIEKAAERAAALCAQMLAYAGKASLTQRQVNVVSLVDEMVTMLKTTIKQNVVIKPSLGTDIPIFMGDASQIRQVIMNLIVNAAEAIGDDYGEIGVSLKKAEITTEQAEQDHLGMTIPAGRYICLEVIDNGCGMDEETQKRLFEPFYTTKFTGRGLGMSAVLGIIKAHKGALQFESRLGLGTVFRVYLPDPFSNSDVASKIPREEIAGLINKP